MKTYLVEMTAQAYDDLAEISKTIVAEYGDETSADKVTLKITDKIGKLKYFPKASAIRFIANDMPLRLTRAGKYTVVYYTDDEKCSVEIVAIMHSHMDIEGILRARDLE